MKWTAETERFMVQEIANSILLSSIPEDLGRNYAEFHFFSRMEEGEEGEEFFLGQIYDDFSQSFRASLYYDIYFGG